MTTLSERINNGLLTTSFLNAVEKELVKQQAEFLTPTNPKIKRDPQKKLKSSVLKIKTDSGQTRWLAIFNDGSKGSGVLGRGKHAKVKLAQDIDTGEIVALKIETNFKKENKGVHSKREREVLKKLKRLIGVAQRSVKGVEREKFYTASTFYGVDNLEQVSFKGMTLRERIIWAIKLLEELQALHAAGIIHRDIKSKNIMIIPATQEIKMIDFGFSAISELVNKGEKIENVRITHFWMGTPRYMAPEIGSKEPEDPNKRCEYTAKSDLYAVGVVFREKIFESVGKEGQYAAQIQMLINSMMHKDRAARPSLEECILALKEIRNKLHSEEKTKNKLMLEKENMKNKSSFNGMINFFKKKLAVFTRQGESSSQLIPELSSPQRLPSPSKPQEAKPNATYLPLAQVKNCKSAYREELKSSPAELDIQAEAARRMMYFVF